MISKVQAVCIFCLLHLTFFANGQDTLVYLEEVAFETPIEAAYFKQVLTGDSDAFFGGFIALSQTDSASIYRWELHLKNFVKEINNQKRPKKNEKYVKKIYEGLHERFLRKYEAEVDFAQIFKGGRYNCVTACAIYGLAFDRLGVPFTIKETPTHVYLIAYPGKEQILIETTDPVSGFKTFSPGFKENFVIQLTTLKLIDQAEASQGVNAIFDKYYFTDEDLGIKELIGIHYYNSGVGYFNNKEYQRAINQFEKAYLLFQSKQVADMLFASTVSVLADTEYKKWEEVSLLSRLLRFEDEYDVGKNDVVGEFGRLLQLHLTNKNDTAYVRKAYSLISAENRNEEIQDELDFLYNYERSRMLYNRGNYKEAIDFAEKAYAAKPGHVDAESLLIGAYSRTYESSRDTEEALGKLEELLGNYEYLKSNLHLGGVWLNLYLIRMGEEFDKRNISQALQYKSRFEKETKENPNYRFNEYELGKAFSKGIVYYFKRGQYHNARKLANEGLEFSPGNSELRSRLYMLNRN